MKVNESWMSGRHGLMVHYLPPMMEGRDGRKLSGVDEAAEAFELERFLADFERTGADYLIFTLGQNTGLYNSPNAAIERYAGPGHCPRRDLAMELAGALKRRGKRFLAYLPTELHCNDTLQQGFGWRPVESREAGGAMRQEVFQRRWCEVIRCWAERFGRLLDGWWLDGCGWLKIDHAVWREALRAGNPEALIAFSYSGFSGGFTAPKLPDDDYFCGETFMLKDGLPRVAGGEGFRPAGASVPGTGGMLWHALVPVDAHWWRGGSAAWSTLDGKRFFDPARLKTGEMEPPMYTDAELLTLFEAFPGQGGAVTLNAGIFLDGSLGEATVDQLERVGKAFSAQAGYFSPSNCML